MDLWLGAIVVSCLAVRSALALGLPILGGWFLVTTTARRAFGYSMPLFSALVAPDFTPSVVGTGHILETITTIAVDHSVEG